MTEIDELRKRLEMVAGRTENVCEYGCGAEEKAMASALLGVLEMCEVEDYQNGFDAVRILILERMSGEKP